MPAPLHPELWALVGQLAHPGPPRLAAAGVEALHAVLPWREAGAPAEAVAAAFAEALAHLAWRPEALERLRWLACIYPLGARAVPRRLVELALPGSDEEAGPAAPAHELACARCLHQVLGLTAAEAAADGHRALRVASRRGRLATVRFLFEEVGLDRAGAEARGGYALRYASLHGHLDVVRYLRERCGTDVARGDHFALRAARHRGRAAVVAYLSRSSESAASTSPASDCGEGVSVSLPVNAVPATCSRSRISPASASPTGSVVHQASGSARPSSSHQPYCTSRLEGAPGSTTP